MQLNVPTGQLSVILNYTLTLITLKLYFSN